MRFISVFGGAVVFLCNLYISFFHTLDLFRSGGLTGGMEYVAAVGAEIAFFTFAVTIVYARLRRIRPGWPSILGGLLGVSLVGWSNIAAGWSYGLVGILIGIYFPAMLLVVEANLTRTAAMRRNQPASQAAESTNQPADQWSKMADQPAASTSHSTTISQAIDHQPASHPGGRKVADQSTSHISQQSAAVNRSISQPNQPVAESVSQVAEVAEKAVEADQPAVSQVAETASQPIDQLAKSASRSANQLTTITTNQSTSVTDQSTSHSTTISHSASSTNQPAEQEIDQVADKPDSQPTNQPANQPSVTKRSNVVDMADRQAVDQKAIEVAERYYKETGELPSRRQLAKMADITPYRASKAINYLKKKYDLRQTKKTASGR